MYVHIGGARPHGGDGPGKVTSVELLAWGGAGYDVCGRDSSSHGPLLRALRGKPGRITSTHLAQPDDDAAVDARRRECPSVSVVELVNHPSQDKHCFRATGAYSLYASFLNHGMSINFTLGRYFHF